MDEDDETQQSETTSQFPTPEKVFRRERPRAAIQEAAAVEVERPEMRERIKEEEEGSRNRMSRQTKREALGCVSVNAGVNAKSIVENGKQTKGGGGLGMGLSRFVGGIQATGV